MSEIETPEFAPSVLRSLPVLVPAGMTSADLALELGLTAHLQAAGVDLDEAARQLWAVRQGLLEAADMDTSLEPIPFRSRSERLGLLNMVIYLGDLLARAAATSASTRESVVERALDRPVVQAVRAPVAERRQLRSS